MQPGDQIVSCNGIDFSNILFSEAVAIMKATSVLELYIRPGAGLDLFPSESSGYNSSASSVTGDQSPCWGEQTKRLSIVREESTNSSDRMNSNNCNTISNGSYNKLRSNRKDKPLHVEVPKVPANYSSKNNHNNTPNTTIINLTENGTLINNTIVPGLSNSNGYAMTTTNGGGGGNNSINEVETPKFDPSKKIADICFVSRQNETKIVTVEVHQQQQYHQNNSNGTVASQNNNNNNLQPINCGGGKDEPESMASNSSSLSSAISDELKRRAEVRRKPKIIIS